MSKTLLKNKTFWLLVSMIIIIVFSFFYTLLDINWLIYPVIVAFAYIIIIGLIMIAYAWIINPIKKLKK